MMNKGTIIQWWRPVEAGQAEILVFVTSDPKTAMLIRRARRVSDFLVAECVAVVLHPTGDLPDSNTPEREALEKHLSFARNLHLETQVLKSQDASAVVDFARQNGVTQTFVTRPTNRAWPRLFSNDSAQTIIDSARDMQIVIVSDGEPVGWGALDSYIPVTSDYFLLRALDLQLQITKETVRAQEDSVKLTELRLQYGVATKIDVLQARQIARYSKWRRLEVSMQTEVN